MAYNQGKMRKIYLDYAATTPLKKEILKEMTAKFEIFGNPSSVHHLGQEAMKVMDASREKAAKILKTDFRGIIFTGSATEADNLAIRGSVTRFFETNRRDSMIPPHIIISGGEHEAVRKTAEALSEEGIELTILPIYEDGKAKAEDLKKAINERTAIVSIIHTSNETGSVNDIASFAEIVKQKREEMRGRIDKDHHYPLLHTDAVQGFGTSEIDFETLGADMITLSAHKIGGPKGVGILAVNKEFTQSTKTKVIKPIITGGDQEMGFRAGTENLALIAGIVKALEITKNNRREITKHLREIKNVFWKELKEIFPEAMINGNIDSDSPHILNVCFQGRSSEDIVTKLDLEGVMISAGSACKARSVEFSRIITSMHDKKRASESVRFSFGEETTIKEIRETLKVLRSIR